MLCISLFFKYIFQMDQFKKYIIQPCMRNPATNPKTRSITISQSKKPPKQTRRQNPPLGHARHSRLYTKCVLQRSRQAPRRLEHVFILTSLSAASDDVPPNLAVSRHSGPEKSPLGISSLSLLISAARVFPRETRDGSHAAAAAASSRTS